MFIPNLRCDIERNVLREIKCPRCKYRFYVNIFCVDKAVGDDDTLSLLDLACPYCHVEFKEDAP